MRELPLDIAKEIASYVNTGRSSCKDTARFALTCKFFNNAAQEDLLKNERKYHPINYLIKKLNQEKQNTKDNNHDQIINELIYILKSLSNFTDTELTNRKNALVLYLFHIRPQNQLNNGIKKIIDEVVEDLFKETTQYHHLLCAYLFNRCDLNPANTINADPWSKIFNNVFFALASLDPDPLAKNRMR